MSANAIQQRMPLYSAIHQAALAQREALRCDDLETFQRLMLQREALLASIEHLSSDEVYSGAEATGSSSQQETPTVWDRQAAQLLQEIIQADRELQTMLAQRIDETRSDLARLRSGRQSVRSYLFAQESGAIVDGYG